MSYSLSLALTLILVLNQGLNLMLSNEASPQPKIKTRVSIQGEKFFINDRPTYRGVEWEGHRIEGLLFNSRMVQGIFDDENPTTRDRWKYPNNNEWNPDRNTSEFIAAMPSWKEHGVLAFTMNMQGGSPMGYGNRGWINSAYDSSGNIKPAYLLRLDRILKRSDELNMVVILGLFYFGQDEQLKDEAAVIKAVDNTINWLHEKGYRNILIEIANECDVAEYNHPIIKPERAHELINRVKENKKSGYRYLVSTSFGGGKLPTPNVVEASDFILLHGNDISDPRKISEMIQNTRRMAEYQSVPILFNEDDHYDFEKPDNNLKAAVESYASWGFFDFRRRNEANVEGFQSVPVDWRINSERKKAFYTQIKNITSALNENEK